MARIVALVVVVVAAVVAAWSFGVFGGGGLSTAEINSKLGEFRDAHVERLGTDIDDAASIRSVNVRDGEARFVIFVADDQAGDLEAETARAVAFICADETLGPLVQGGAKITLDISAIDAGEIGEAQIDASNCAA